ncbi:hypothetical protein SDC9_123168 [bioreactor metagenome]|uniref:Uncharacterized protein n=1 Tax=bioreactor metagenome TaxID=1076179 RepID=A0A645CH24_9ZZZZ
MSDGSISDIWFGNRPHFNRRLHPCGDSSFFKRILQCQSVHGGCQHSHVIRDSPVHMGALTTPPEVPAPDYDSHLNARIHTNLDMIDHRLHHLYV